VVKTWEIRDLDALLRLEPQVVFDRNTLETRYRFRPDQAIHVIAVRTFALPRTASVPMNDRYEGCRSWVSLDEEIGIDDSRPVLDDSQLRTKIDAVAAALSG
jgi:hypothetical protein